VTEVLTAALGRVVRPLDPVPYERLANALGEELSHLGSLSERRAVCPARAQARCDLLEARAAWLRGGTAGAALASLDPERDSDRIVHHLMSTFRIESRLVETLAINRVSTWECLSLFLRSTGEAEHNSAARFFDTYALFANFFEWGLESQRGEAALRRMNTIHGRYYLPNEGMKYVLLNTAFTWLDGIDRLGHRRLSRLERVGFFLAHVRLGKAMNIANLQDDYDAMYAWFVEVNAANAFSTPLKRDTFETFVKNSLGAEREQFGALRLALSVGMDDHYRAALDYATPTPRQVAQVRGAVGRLVVTESTRPPGAWVRSLSVPPGRARCPRPEALGVADRSSDLPGPAPGTENGGYPQSQCPLQQASDAAPLALPAYDWAMLRRQVAAGRRLLVIEGEVHDVGGWLRYHPGGCEALGQWLGRDATAAFRQAGHSALTEVYRLNYRVGRMSPAAVPL
jgi:hypothetical protein